MIASEPSPAERGLAEGRGSIFVKLVEQGDIIVRGAERLATLAQLIKEAWTRWRVPEGDCVRPLAGKRVAPDT